jgi:hypothetical protein
VWDNGDVMMIKNILTALTRAGWTRQILSAINREWLFSLDVWEVSNREHPAGRHILEWTPNVASDAMAERVTELIRRAPRPRGCSDFLLQVGAHTLEDEWMTNTPERVRAFFAQCADARPGRVKLFLLGEVFATALQKNGWVTAVAKTSRG